MAKKQPPDYPALGKQVGELVARKQLAYGDSFGRSAEIFRVLFPTGIPPERYADALAIVRIVDKLFRLATEPDALGESPGLDIAGYGLLIAAAHGAAPELPRPTLDPAYDPDHAKIAEPAAEVNAPMAPDQTIYPRIDDPHRAAAGRRFA